MDDPDGKTEDLQDCLQACLEESEQFDDFEYELNKVNIIHINIVKKLIFFYNICY